MIAGVRKLAAVCHNPQDVAPKKKKRPFNLTKCGTKSKKKKAGSFAFDLFIYETGNEYRLYWKKHEQNDN